jgi:hypothetical protein
MSSTPKFGEFAGTVAAINISISQSRPAIFTRLKIKVDDKAEEIITHAVRLENPDSQRIGFDELRSAFPGQLGSLNDEQLLTTLIEKTDEFAGKPVHVGIEPQLKNGVQVVGAQGQKYFNIRLRSAVRNLDTTTAASIAKKLLSASGNAKSAERLANELTEHDDSMPGDPAH